MLAVGKEEAKMIPVSFDIFSGKAKLFKVMPASFKADKALAIAIFAVSLKVLASSAEMPVSLSKSKALLGAEVFIVLSRESIFSWPQTIFFSSCFSCSDKESSLIKLLPAKTSSKVPPKSFTPTPLITI